MAKNHALLWILGGAGALFLLGGGLGGSSAQANQAGGSPAAGGGSPLGNLFSNLFGGGSGGGSAPGYQPPGGGFYTGLGNNYMPVNYSPTATNYTAYGAASPGPTSYFSPAAGGVTPGQLV